MFGRHRKNDHTQKGLNNLSSSRKLRWGPFKPQHNPFPLEPLYLYRRPAFSYPAPFHLVPWTGPSISSCTNSRATLTDTRGSGRYFPLVQPAAKRNRILYMTCTKRSSSLTLDATWLTPVTVNRSCRYFHRRRGRRVRSTVAHMGKAGKPVEISFGSVRTRRSLPRTRRTSPARHYSTSCSPHHRSRWDTSEQQHAIDRCVDRLDCTCFAKWTQQIHPKHATLHPPD